MNDNIESNGQWDTPEYHDASDSGKKKEAKAFTFYRMETEDISEIYDAPCFVNGLEAYDGEINLEHDKNLISNEFAFKLCLEHEVKNEDKVVKKELIVEKGIADFGNGIITIYPDLDPFNDVDFNKTNDSEDDWEVILEGIDFGEIPEIDGLELSPYVCNMEEANEEMIREYKATKETEDPSMFVLPIRLEGRFDTHALADTGSNINIIPYGIFEELGREHVKPVSHNVSMLNHSEADPMRMLKDVLCQIGVTT
ncbi:putative reverse transcriptase domain-containing protein, partial [Tanacetum coccineum]